VEPEIPGLVGLVLLLALSFYFTAARSALVNARRQALRELAEKGNRRAGLAAAVAEDSSKVLGTFHLAGTLTHFLIASLAISMFFPGLAGWLVQRLAVLQLQGTALSYLLIALPMALLVYLVTEMLPDALVHGGDADQWAMALARPAALTIAVFRPLVWVLMKIRHLIAAPLGSQKNGVTEEEIMTLVDAGEEEGSIELGEKEMIYSIFQLDDTVAREIMIPRIDIVAVNIETTVEAARETIISAGHSRIPVYEGSLDHILGVLYAKDLLAASHRGDGPADLRTLLRPARFVPESKKVRDLLRELQTGKVHIAVVIDEYGGTAGLVTLEDIVEEIFGEIQDEYDSAEEALYEEIGPDETIFDARINLDDFNHVMDTHLPDESGDTLAGFIYSELGKVPDPGDIVRSEMLQLEVLSVEDRRIRKVRVTRTEPEEPTPPSLQTGKDHRDTLTNGHSNGR
jgi:putative hemolysin